MKKKCAVVQFCIQYFLHLYLHKKKHFIKCRSYHNETHTHSVQQRQGVQFVIKLSPNIFGNFIYFFQRRKK